MNDDRDVWAGRSGDGEALPRRCDARGWAALPRCGLSLVAEHSRLRGVDYVRRAGAWSARPGLVGAAPIFFQRRHVAHSRRARSFQPWRFPRHEMGEVCRLTRDSFTAAQTGTDGVWPRPRRSVVKPLRSAPELVDVSAVLFNQISGHALRKPEFLAEILNRVLLAAQVGPVRGRWASALRGHGFPRSVSDTSKPATCAK